MTHADHITPWHPDCAICRAVTDPGIRDDEPWEGLERHPGFSERVERGKAQLAAGERVEFDPIAPARGCLNGALLGLLLWVAFFGGAALVLSRVL